jgi:AcrR family transcriptional regulator
LVRKKVYTREQILQAAHELVEKEGFSKFTARNIAKQMGISTQPIYLEFKNMDDLKNTVLDEIFEQLFTGIFPKKVTGDPLVDLGLNFINFANDNKRLFQALYVEEYGCGQKMYDASFENYHNMVKGSEKYANVDEQHIDALHVRTWVVVTGLAVLTTSGIIHPTQEQLITTIEDTIDMVLKNPNPIHIE